MYVNFVAVRASRWRSGAFSATTDSIKSQSIEPKSRSGPDDVIDCLPVIAVYLVCKPIYVVWRIHHSSPDCKFVLFQKIQHAGTDVHTTWSFNRWLIISATFP